MKLDLFPVTVFIGNVDLKKIKLKSEINTAFLSNTPTSIDSKNELDPESAKYILNVIGNLMHEQYKHFKLDLLSIWRNKYQNNDFQEPHIHCNSKFSFIIYEKVNKVNTVFFNPAKYLIDCIGADYVYRNFTPQLKTGQIIIFPSYVEHMVNKNSDQVTISGNLGFKWTQ
jgi:hypothetical protein